MVSTFQAPHLNAVGSSFLKSVTPGGSGGRPHQQLQKRVLAKPIGNRCVNSKRKSWEVPSESGIQELWILGQY